jgi:hypothetical protein
LFRKIDFLEFLFGFFEHQLFFSLFLFLFDKYLFLSLSPDSYALIGRDSYEEISDTGAGKTPDLTEEVIKDEDLIIGVRIIEFHFLVFRA